MSSAAVVGEADHPMLRGCVCGLIGEALDAGSAELLTIAPPPCTRIRGISYFIYRSTLRRLMAMIRSQSASVRSAAAAGCCSTPAL